MTDVAKKRNQLLGFEPDDDRIVSHDAIFYVHVATSKLSLFHRQITKFSTQSISYLHCSKR